MEIHCVGQKVDFVDFVELFAGSFNHKVFLGEDSPVFWPAAGPSVKPRDGKGTSEGHMSWHLWASLASDVQCKSKLPSNRWSRCSHLLMPCGSSMCCSRRSLTLWFYRRAHGLIWRQFVNLPCRGFCRSGFVYLYSKCIEIYYCTHYFTPIKVWALFNAYLQGFSWVLQWFALLSRFLLCCLDSTALLSRSDQKSDELQETSRASKEFGHRAAVFVSFPAGLPHYSTFSNLCLRPRSCGELLGDKSKLIILRLKKNMTFVDQSANKAHANAMTSNDFCTVTVLKEPCFRQDYIL